MQDVIPRLSLDKLIHHNPEHPALSGTLRKTSDSQVAV